MGAARSSLLFLVSIILSLTVSAYRPLLVEKYEAVAPSSPTNKEENNEVIDQVDLGMVPNKVPALGDDSRFHFQVGPIGFGATWNIGFHIPIFGPPVVLPSYTLPYYQPGSYLNPYESQVQGQGQLPGQASSPNLPVGSSKGVNSQSTHN